MIDGTFLSFMIVDFSVIKQLLKITQSIIYRALGFIKHLG